MFIRCFGPTFSETEFPPHDPHPSVNDGANLKLYKSPIPPWVDGVFINVLPVFIAALNLATFSGHCLVSTYKTEVCPYPPNSTNLSAFLKASSKFLVLYIAKTGDNFSCENSSSNSTEVTSPTKTLAVTGTFTPANSAILWAGCPTILAFKAPFIKIVFLTFSTSAGFKM